MGKASQLPGIYLCTIGRQVLVIDTWPTGDDSAEIVRKHSKGLVQFADADELSVILKNDGTLVPFGATPDRARLEGMGSVVEIATGYLDNLLTVVEPKIPDSGRKITPPVTRKPWTGGVANKNSLDMEFLPVPGFEKILFSKWETRVSNYQQFAAAMLENPPPPIFSLSAEDWVQSENTWSSPGFDQTPDHPVVGVGFSDAKRFCNWLTCKEREAGLIPPEAEYRLPSDSEWAGMADLHEVGGTASVRIAMGEDSPLATSPADLAKIGNFAGDELKVLGLRVACLPNYSDPYPFTAPVTSQPEDARGFCGVFGNVWEICDDFHGADTQYRVVRGESWSSGAPLDGMMPSARLKMPPGGRRQDVGFRVVLDLGSNRARNRLIAQDLMDDLRLRNGIKPQYGTAKFEAHGLGIHFPGIPPLTDLSPLRGVPLTSLDIGQSSVSDLGPLQGAPLEDLDLKASKVADLSALRGAPLKFLNIDDTAVADLSPLADSPIENLSMENIPAKDFTPLAHMPLRKLYAFGTGLTDLSVLRGKRLILLSLHRTPVNDLSPLVGMPLQQLVLAGTEVTDLKPLQGMPLRTLVFHPQRIKNGLEVLLDLRDLEAVHIVPADADAKSKSRQLTRDQLHSAIRTGDWGWEK
jgi:hypothetical protein